MPFLRSQKRIVSVAALMYIRIFGKFFSSIRSSSVYHGLFYIPSSTHFVKLFNFEAILLIYIHKPLSLSHFHTFTFTLSHFHFHTFRMGALSLVASLPWPLLSLQLLLTWASNLWLFTSSLLIYEVFGALEKLLNPFSSASTWLLAPPCSAWCGGYQIFKSCCKKAKVSSLPKMSMHRWV